MIFESGINLRLPFVHLETAKPLGPVRAGPQSSEPVQMSPPSCQILVAPIGT